MAGIELMIQKKKKKKRQLLDVPKSSICYSVIEEEASHKKHKKKKSKDSEKDEQSQAKVEHTKGQKKRKRRAEDGNSALALLEESEDFAVTPQEGEMEMKKKKKKGRTEEVVSAGENSHTEETLSQVQRGQQKPVKVKNWPTEDTHASRPTHTQLASHSHPPADTPVHSPINTQPHLEMLRKVSNEINVDLSVLQEIHEFMPDLSFTTNQQHIKRIIRYDLPRFREFKQQGIPVRKGRFTVAENMKLKQNVENFLAFSRIESPFMLFRSRQFRDETENIPKLRRKLNFLKCLCSGIPHTYQSILAKASRLFNHKNFKGRFTEKEKETLMNLHKLHGNNWKVIGEKLDRGRESVKLQFSLMTVTNGPWSEAEFKTLLNSVREELLQKAEPRGDGTDGSAVIQKVELYKRLRLFRVARQVKTRNFLQCRAKWMEYLTKKISTGGTIQGRKSLEGKIQLIKAIYSMAVEDPAEIVWDDLTHLFGNTPPDYLRMRFYKLKVTHVPGWNTMSFCDIIDFLYEKTLPQLEKELETCEEEEEPTEARQSYKLSEIFPDL